MMTHTSETQGRACGWGYLLMYPHQVRASEGGGATMGTMNCGETWGINAALTVVLIRTTRQMGQRHIHNHNLHSSQSEVKLSTNACSLPQFLPSVRWRSHGR